MAGDAATAVEAAAMAAAVGTVAAKAVRAEAIDVRILRIINREMRSISGIGQGWIRTSEGVKPADLQSAPFGHFGTYPLLQAEHSHPVRQRTDSLR